MVAKVRAFSTPTLALVHPFSHLPGTSLAQTTHLSQVTLHKSKESLMFPTITAAAVDVQQLKTETLPLLKTEVQGEHLGEAGAPTAGDHFSAVHLKKSNPVPGVGTHSDSWAITPCRRISFLKKNLNYSVT